MTGQIVLKESSSISDFTKGLKFPDDPFGGSGDLSGLRLYASSGESMVLEMYVQNDSGTDKINFATGIAGGLSNDDVTINGNKIWNAGNLTPQSQLNGTGFVKATGTTISYDNTSYLPLAGGTMTGPLGLTGTGTNQFIAGTGDGATLSVYNFALSGWNGMAFYNPTGGGAFPNAVSGVLDFRNGTINMRGGFIGGAFSGTSASFSGLLNVRSSSVTPSIWSGLFGGAITILGDNGTANRWIDMSIVDSTGAIASQGLRVVNSGNVLINTTTDNGSKLQVNGDSYFSGATNIPAVFRAVEPSVEIRAIGASNGATLALYPTTGYNANVGNFNGGNLILFAASTAVATVATTGITAPAFFETSDIRFKNVLETNPNINVLGIDVIKFTRTDDDTDSVRYGYSAQQVQEVIPEAVKGDEKLSVNYMDVHTLKIAALEKRIAELEAKLK